MAPTVLIYVLMSLFCSSLKASIRVDPDQSQFFEEDSLSLICDGDGTVKRNTSYKTYKTSSECRHWGTVDGDMCEISYMRPFDSGSYWCESTEGEKTDPVHITVRDGGVILLVPVLPVTEGDSVSLSCRHHTSIVQSATFYKDNTVQSEQPTGNLTIQQVALSDEGVYQCETGGERSETSRLRVTPGPIKPSSTETPPLTTETPPPSDRPLPLALLCHLLVLCPYVVSTVLMVSLYRQLGPDNKRSVTMGTQSDPGLDDVYDDVATVHQF